LLRLPQKIDADYRERLTKQRQLAASNPDGVVNRGLGVTMSNAADSVDQDPEDPAVIVSHTQRHGTSVPRRPR